MRDSQTWYVVKQTSGACQILTVEEFESNQAKASPSEVVEHWGPFTSEGEAIARRVGLIRSGKCKPS